MREQFPKIIEDRRKQLYPEMKRAKLNKENKVRLVRDKLYINQQEFIPKRNNNENQTSGANQQNQSYGQRSRDIRYHQGYQQNMRTEYGSSYPPAGDSFVGGVHFIETEIDKDLRQTDRPSLQNAREMLISHFLLQTGLTY